MDPGGPRGGHFSSDLVARMETKNMGFFYPQEVHAVDHAARQVCDPDIGGKGVRVARAKVVRGKDPCVWRQLFFPPSDNYNSRFPLASKASPYLTRVKRREPVGRPEFHPPAAVSPLAFRPVLCV